MNTERIKEIQTNEVLRKRLAKSMAKFCFRMTAIEDFHGSRKAPKSLTGDYSDVKVVSAREDIPWNEVERLNDDEMKALMIDVVNHCDQFLTILFTMPAGDTMIEDLKQRDAVPEWNDPE
jgi:hypothetical protein